jgi:hypothetical protein
MITQETHRIDWHKTARTSGVVLLALGKALWWLTKHGGLLLIAIAAILGKVFMVLVSVWASTPDTDSKQGEENDTPILDVWGNDLRYVSDDQDGPL